MAAPGPDRLAAAMRALEAQLTGGLANELDLPHLRDVEQWLGTKRPLSEYAPRTRRRYLSAAKRGERQPNRSEYQKRKARTQQQYGGISPNQLTRLRKYARQNESMLRREPQNADLHFDDDFLRAITETYGYDFAVEVFKEQQASISEWDTAEDQSQGPHHPGNARYFGNHRAERESRLARLRGRGMVANTDSLYYYHGHV
jgi:hypothetical protein